MLRSNPFIPELLSVIGGVMIVVATIAFITIPYSLERHPGAGTTLAANAQPFHLT
jgi:hypothetical protein